MNIVVETNCNQACDFCFAHEILARNHIPARMELVQIQFLLSFLGDQPRKVNILGGEPTLHPHLPQIIKSFYDAGHMVTLLTNGLGNTAVIAQCLPFLDNVLINYRHPDAYTADQSRKLAAVMALLLAERASRFKPQRALGIDLGVTFTNIDQDYDYLLFAGLEYQPRSIRWDLSKPSMSQSNQWFNPFVAEQTGDWIVEFVKRFDDAGMTTSIDCPVPYCIFSDAQICFLKDKVSRFRGRCNPALDILPGLYAIHCFPLAGVCDPVQLCEVENYDTLFRFIYGMVHKGALDVGVMEKCRQCRWHAAGQCQGYCPALGLYKV